MLLTIYIVCWLALFPTGIAVYAFRSAAIGEIERCSPKVADKIGHPCEAFSTPRGAKFVYWFVLTGRYRQSGIDASSMRFCRKLQVACYVQLATLGAWALSLVALTVK
jgi:hypothetical protein